MLLQLESVGKTFPGARGDINALDDVSLEVDAGQLVAVCGPSGCGKSTLLLTAGCLLQPSRGTVRVCGEDPYAQSPESRAAFRGKNIGFVFQQFHLVPYLSVIDNILTPTMATNSQDGRERAEALIEQFGLADRKDHLAAKLSSGERQRTALARAVMNQPSLLLADEPTGNLDRENAEIVLGHLRAFVDAGGGVLLVTHDEQAVSIADSVLRMESGKLNQPSAVAS